MLLSYRPCDSDDYYGIRRNPPNDTSVVNSWGIKTPENMYFLRGLPLVEYRDLTRPDDQPVDMDDFRERILLPNWIDNSLDNHFVPESVRMTLVKWGPGKDQCGKITIARENWMGFFSIVSYVGVTIEKSMAFASGVVIMDAFGPIDPTKPAGLDNMYMAPVHIQENVWIGANTIVMPGVTIGHHCTIGARSVVAKDIPPHSVAIGNPAEVVQRFVK